MSDLFSRQSFLGKESQALFRNTRVGIIGLGGGGSHIAQQSAHIGFGKFAIFDPDFTDFPNLNRTGGDDHLTECEERIHAVVSDLTKAMCAS